MPSVHSVIGPSGAPGWMRCNGSPAAQKKFANKSSVFADEGTAAHEMSELALRSDGNCSAFVGRIADNGWAMTEEMAADAQIYVDSILEYSAGHTLLIEQAVSIEHITGEPGGMGTSDAVIIMEEARELQIHDLKFGKGVLVNAFEGKGPNEQMAMYALGVYEKLRDLYDFDTVLLVIHQPRLGHLSEHRITVAELLAFGEKAKAAAKIAWDLYQRIDTDWDILEQPGVLVPGEKQCKFCRAKGSCTAVRNLALKTIVDDFDVVADAVPSKEVIEKQIVNLDQKTDEQLDKVYPILAIIEDWGRAVLAQIDKRLHEGSTDFKNCKLVQGKRGSRAWIDKAAVEATMKAMRLKETEMYDFSLISPTSADKLLSKSNPKRWAKLLAMITQSDGRPSVAPITDKRDALVIQAASDDFGDESGADLVG